MERKGGGERGASEEAVGPGVMSGRDDARYTGGKARPDVSTRTYAHACAKV